MNSPQNPVWLFLRLSRPLFLLGAALLFALGAGIARYLGHELDWTVYLLGQTWVTALQLSTHYLNEYFDSPADNENPNRTPFNGGSGALGEGRLPRATALWAGAGCLLAAAYLTVLLMQSGGLVPAAGVFMVLIFLGAFFYSVPPVRLASSGYGEVTTSVVVAGLVPALGFLLQAGELHRLVAMTTSPLLTLHLAMMLVFEMPDYANDLRFRKQTLLVRAGWQTGMVLHNILLLSAYVLLGMGMLLGLPLAIALPAFLTLPLALLQVWQFRRIAEGGRPNWTALTLNALAVFGACAYLLTFAFWTR